MSLILKQYIEQLKSFESSVAIFDAEIEKIYDTFDCQLHTITGIGKTLAAVIFSEIGGDISKFDSVPKLVAFAGLYPKNRQFGESINSKGHLFLICAEKFGLPLLSLFLKILPFANFMSVKLPKANLT